MGTSLSGLTPATTFDGLLKVGDNDPLDGTLKTIGTGDGTDSVLQLSNSALQVNGAATINGGQATIVGAGNDNTTTALLVQNSDGDNILKIDNSNAIEVISGVFRVRKASNNAQIFYVSETYSASAQKTMINSLSSPDASLQVKGSGTTSATASLLVQNSAGTDMLKVQDDSSLLMYRASNGVELLRIGESGGNAILYANGNANRSLVLGYENTLTAFNQSVFKTYNGTGYSEAMVITGNSNTSQFVGIGETTPTARLHVKGSGTTSATTSLLVQNSAGTEHLKVTDDGEVNVREVLYVNHSSVSSRALRLGWGSIYGTDNSSELSIGAVLVQAATAPRIVLGGKTRGSGADAIQVQTLNGMYIATTAFNEDPSAQLHIKGSGNDNTTTALLVQNSDASASLTYDDSGKVEIVGNSQTGFIQTYGFGAVGFGNESGPTIIYGNNLAGLHTSSGYTAFGANSSSSQRVLIKGSGATSATTALLVQNSGGADLLKVVDDGTLRLAGNKSVRFFGNESIEGSNQGGNHIRIAESSFWGSTRINAPTNITEGNDAPDASAMLQVDSTTQGFLPPRMTDAERDAIATPAAGLMIYDTTNNQMNYWNGSTWIAF